MILKRRVALVEDTDVHGIGSIFAGAIQSPGSKGVRHHVAVVVLDSAASLHVGWILDVLAEANRITEAGSFSWEVLSFAAYMEGNRFGSGHCPPLGFETYSGVFVAGDQPQLKLNGRQREKLRERVRRLSLALACGPAVELFAVCSLLRNLAAAASRTTRFWLREKYPDIGFLDEPFYWCGTIGTACGGVATVAAVLELLARLGLPRLVDELKGRLLLPNLKVGQHGLYPRARYGARSRKIAKAVFSMQENLESGLQIESLALQVGSSVRQLERLFKVEMGTTPARFMKRLRLEQARELLRNTDLSIVQISCATGFESPTHFSRCFKHAFSMAPTKWREGAPGK